MEDDDDNESVVSVSRSGENNALNSKYAILKGAKESGLTSRRDRRRYFESNFYRCKTGSSNIDGFIIFLCQQKNKQITVKTEIATANV